MKRLVYTLFLLSSLSLPAIAQQTDNHDHSAVPSNANNPNAPVMTFIKEVHDFGTIKNGGDGTYEFKFKNTGNEPLIITNARGSCGCTVPTWPKEPIKKGETGVIKVSYDTKRTGSFTKTVTIDSNSKTGTKVLTIKGVVEPVEVAKEQTVPLKKVDDGMPFENSKSKFK